MLFDCRSVETVKHTYKGTSFTNRQWQCVPDVNKGTFDANRNVDSQCRAACLLTTVFSKGHVTETTPLSGTVCHP